MAEVDGYSPSRLARAWCLFQAGIEILGEEEALTREEAAFEAVLKLRAVDALRLSAAEDIRVIERFGDWDPEPIRHEAHVARTDVDNLRAVARNLHDLGESAVALRQGEIGFGHLVHESQLADFCRRHRVPLEDEPADPGDCHELDAPAGPAFRESELLDIARSESVGAFGFTCRDKRHEWNPEGDDDDGRESVEKRSLTYGFNRCTQMRTVHAELDDPAFTEVKNAIEAGAQKSGAADNRDIERRRADSLLEATRAAVCAKTRPGRSTSPVALTVTCSAETLEGIPGAPAATTEYGTRLSPETIGRYSCDCALTLLALDKNLVPVGLSRTKRTLSDKEMQALRAQYPTCIHKGCNRPSQFCEAHHLRWWSRGGTSELENMVMLCLYHHWQVHEGRWTLARDPDDPDGELLWLPPASGVANAIAMTPNWFRERGRELEREFGLVAPAA